MESSFSHQAFETFNLDFKSLYFTLVLAFLPPTLGGEEGYNTSLLDQRDNSTGAVAERDQAAAVFCDGVNFQKVESKSHSQVPKSFSNNGIGQKL